MDLSSVPLWPTALLACVVLADAAMSLRPPGFIRDCLDGVRFPRDWWWLLIYVKLLAVAGLVAGFWLPGIGVAANVGVVAYFVAAVIAHVRARFYGRVFFVNCLGMLALALATLALTLLL
ncbi:hypothetical protein BW730_00565 [Tessaracoccus aquimaris]|uniref:DoxX family protein n=1 Tax=Tessaracoccus aquimaris TaxID=1332264 RepID=A0A1Q2CJH5_9ACTN|nr:DoxX family protein [Tessaracoccus aquimaris]AQP46288.1 hypothetical protein BW730_00565 [Tessaracoccus aquimaris]